MPNVNASAFHLPYPSGIAQMCVTSPPYWGLRDYGVAGQFGLEKTPDCYSWARGVDPCGECYTCRTVEYMREVWRVLRDDGVCFLNIGQAFYFSIWGLYVSLLYHPIQLPPGQRHKHTPSPPLSHLTFKRGLKRTFQMESFEVIF